MLVGAAQRVEHYEMAGYGNARAIAEALGHDDVARILQQTLDEEGAANKKLTDICQSDLIDEACECGDDDDSPKREKSLGERLFS
jgi:ferritin-like metal-binding protein YciE